ncbi:CHAT domain-containing protein [Marinoscillum sp. MHG1-6]|uniref:CHAT domain-containing protein n=1 Tax=Marinoscillum sp. MHG1-6 TaxID=2959627 RepID=UPI002157C519|nr:CHAT domain-containing protein [Marinoscillum sp. MHG1-6]
MRTFTGLLISFACCFLATAQSFDELNDGIELSMNKGLWIKAESQIEYCLQNYDIDSLTRSGLLHNLGYCEVERGDYVSAKYHLEQALAIKIRHYGYKNFDYAETAELLGDLSIQIGDYERAKKYLHEASDLMLSESGAMSKKYMTSLINLGRFYETIGIYSTAELYYQKVNEIVGYSYSEISPEHANILNHLGSVLIKSNQLNRAENHLIEAISIYQKLGPKYALSCAEVIETMATLNMKKGDFASAEKLLLEVEQVLKSTEGIQSEMLAKTLNGLGILYLELVNLERSKGYFSEVINLINVDASGVQYATAMNNLAAIARMEGDFALAKELFSKALTIYQKIYGTMHPNYASALNNLASVERLLANYSEAEAHYKKVMEIDRAIYGEDHPQYATSINNLGVLYTTMGKPQQAGTYYEQALDIRKRSLGINHPAYAKSLNKLGLHYFSQNDLRGAQRCFKEAIDIHIKQISTIFPTFTSEERNLFYANIREDIERYNYVAYKLLGENPELVQDILNYQIATKGILFTSSERIQSTIQSSFDNNLIDQYEKWARAKTRLAGLYQIGEHKLRDYGIDLKVEERALERMEKNLLLSSDLFSGLFPEERIDWRDIRRSLKPDQVLVQIIRFREFDHQLGASRNLIGFTDKVNYMFVIVRPDTYLNPEYIVAENGAALEAKGYSLYNNSMKYDVELHTSYLNYWSELDKKLDGVKSVVVSPDGVYFKMNPNVFKVDRDNYVMDKYYVAYITNSRDIMKHTRQSDVTQPTATLIGNPTFGMPEGRYNLNLEDLPGAQNEVNIISDMLLKKDWNVRLLVNQDANEFRLKNSYHPTILHIATHGYFEQDDMLQQKITPGALPMFKSGLYLAGAMEAYGKYVMGEFQDSDNDGILSAYEAVNLNLQNTRLVVLSACETSRGGIESGEGVYGLQRAMMVAGAQNVITSLLKVDDGATQLLMTYFYQEFMSSDNVMEALRLAQLRVREKYPDPRVWGAFLLTGNG